MSNLTELTPFPTRPENEVPRDNLVVQIAGDFNANCPKQAVTGEPLTGKTNLLAQFASYYSERCLSYFITDDPWTQRQYTFLYNLCNQLCVLLQEPPPPIAIDLENLKSQFAALGTKLNRKAQKTKTSYFFVIDGLEWGIEGVEGDRIIDVLPQTFPISPYLLYSCQTSKIDMLPKHLKLNHVIKPLSFSVSETGSFLAELGYSTEEIKKLHKRHQGNPGSLKAVYDAKKSDPGFSLESALQEYDQMIEQQIKFLMDTVPDSVQKSLAFLSASPTGLSLELFLFKKRINSSQKLE
jgi:hypothetical protein